MSFGPDSRWYAGPEFLQREESCWPKMDKTPIPTTEELRQPVLQHVESPSPWIEVHRFSRWERLQRSVAYVHRFLKRRRLSKAEGIALTREELQQAERTLWRFAQSEIFAEELRILKANKRLDRGYEKNIDCGSPLAKLSPFVDEHGVIRMETRSLNAAYAPCSVIILPRHHRITFLIVDWYHRRYGHANNETVVNEMRQSFHVSRLRTLIKQVAKQCQHCIVKKAKPQIPRMGPLPEVRMTPYVRPFTYTGVDYCGPFLVKVGRSLVKRWIALFTCMTIRAVHLEVAYSLSTDSFKMVVRRFIARRGAPIEIFSDNGTNFRGASNELKEEMKTINKELAATFTNTITKWNFNPPLAPHMGGCWERLVRSVKSALSGLELVKNPDDETLWTLMIEAEAMVNSRPLTYAPLDSVEEEALTPNHFMMLSSSGVCQPPRSLVDDRMQIRSNWRLIQHLLNQFWSRWIKEYLPTITRRTKWFKDVKPVEEGDVVIVVDEGTRNGWIRGRVARTLPGKDGRVRQADVETGSGILRRPVAKIAVLDVVRGKASAALRVGACSFRVSSNRSILQYGCDQTDRFERG
ncbi:hypothetical protein RP20_CCG028086 [Aedes albopictus]|nr:hypothetical protein RP20_CCG028086 [Aedes albopictus]